MGEQGQHWRGISGNPTLSTVYILALSAAVALVFHLWPSIWPFGSDRAERSAVVRLLAQAGAISQEDEGAKEAPENAEVPPTDVDKYIRIYRAMHRDRNLTVEQAAQKEGWTLEELRSVEAKVERDDVLRDHVRQELLKSAEKPAGSKSGKPRHSS